GSNDALAAVAVLKAMPEIDANHIFLVGFSLGGYSSLLATDSKNPASHNGAVAGVIAYYPLCYDGVDPPVAALVLIGEQDASTPAFLWISLPILGEGRCFECLDFCTWTRAARGPFRGKSDDFAMSALLRFTPESRHSS